MKFEAQITKLGRDLGVIIPPNIIEKLKIKSEENVFIEIQKKENPLKELWGFGKQFI